MLDIWTERQSALASGFYTFAAGFETSMGGSTSTFGVILTLARLQLPFLDVDATRTFQVAPQSARAKLIVGHGPQYARRLEGSRIKVLFSFGLVLILIAFTVATVLL